jgi:L-ascorbate metabolism protein UlaG (beta-lactamase superfamily)
VSGTSNGGGTANDHLLFEPLIGNFPAFLQLLSPASSALRLAKAQLPTLESYLEAPEAHASGAAHPATKGGPFVGLPPEDFDRVAGLTDELREEHDLLDLASAIDELATMLDEFEGEDFSSAYLRTPKALRGMVEFVYDGRNRPRALFREALLYSGRYDPTRREGIYLTVGDGDDRPFMLSTPRVTSDRGIVVRIPLRDEAIDVIARSRLGNVPLGELRDAVGPEVAGSPLFDQFWSEGITPETRRWDGGHRVRYFGHACLAFETADASVVIDPFVSPRPGEDRFCLRDLPPTIDYCLITHGHADHFVLETLLELRHRIGTVVVPANLGGELFDPSLRLCLEHLGFTDVIEVRDLDRIPIPGGEIIALPFAGEHGDLAIGAKSTYLVDLGGRRSMVGADTRALPDELYEIVADTVGPIDDIFLGLECEGAPLTWMYGPLFPRPVARKLSMARRLNGADASEAMRLVSTLGAGRIFIYALGEEPWLQHVMATNYTPESYQLLQAEELAAACATRNVEYRHLFGKATIT